MTLAPFVIGALLLAGTAVAQTPAQAPAEALRALAPTGTLRAAINFGNPVLAQRGPNGEAGGVSGALAAELAKRLGVTLTVVPFEQAGKVTDALGSGVWDICFLAKDPVRGQGIAFTAPYVLIEGGYAVVKESDFTDIGSVDRPGVTVGVVKGSAYDLYLTRALKNAVLERYAKNQDAFDAFLSGRVAVLAGVKQPVAALVAAHTDLRMIPGRFMSIEQTMGTPKDRDAAGIAYLERFIAEMKASGFVKQALDASGQHDAEVAP